MNGKLLIVDDHKQVLKALIQLLEPEFESVTGISNPNQIISYINNEEYDVILLDMNFSAGVNTGNEGIYWLGRILKSDPLAVVVMITAYSDVNLAVRAIKEGATDFVVKPWDNNKLIASLQAAFKLRQSKIENKKLRNRQKQINRAIIKQDCPLIGKSKAMENVFQVIKKVARTDANVLVIGENGTGKELIVKEIHNISCRADEAFVSVDIGTITDTLFESEMFGHIKGAFTDAKEDKTGWFETASGGTLFLDEIGNLSLTMQSKILTAIQNRIIFKVGSKAAIPFDIRLICATNKNLPEMVSKNLFREDLYYRINTIVIEIPPLRDRGEDIILLAEHFLKEYANKYEKYYLKFSSKTLDQLMKYTWPGNVRELRHTIEKAVILCDSDILKPEDFIISHSAQQSYVRPKSRTLAEIEKNALQIALDNNYGSVLKASQELGIARQTMYNKMHKYNL
ncbi:MAG TPA: sigma-54 dependent transcriptional regulator [Bacteroidales bacterium]|jgi:DNA-binding NtrC family response regulator|nr:sigma-54 dependent transcriptional regulator [Bacteroidales bacterium]HOX74211.1 sigma-54 dependent transcriptional regulator [Bacteroidales bacterium]HQM69743.1 sigma-54 dependent transcriptional regulator [Bacteroidales bacterium]